MIFISPVSGFNVMSDIQIIIIFIRNTAEKFLENVHNLLFEVKDKK